MTAKDPGQGGAPAGVGDLARLAWPTVLSFLCNSAYRVNDQFWIQGLGPEAHAALGPSTFLMILNFSLFFLAVSGSMSLVARATGARQNAERDQIVRHTLVLAAIIAVVLSLVAGPLTPAAVAWLGMEGPTADLAEQYMGTMYRYTLPLALAPVVETFFISMGNTRVPLVLQGIAVSTNFVLNPCLIYGFGPFEAQGMAGAALATCISRGISATLGIVILTRVYRVRLLGGGRIEPRRLLTILSIGLPSSISIGIYAGVYFALIRTVLTRLGDPVLGGLSIGFNAFEGVAFPVYLGLAVAGSSLVGRNLGAGAQELAAQAVRSMRWMGLLAGALFTALFVLLAPQLVPLFTDDSAVAAEAVRYVRILSASQLFVAMETVHEKVLLGAGHTAPISWISVPGNVLRVPLAWLFAVELGGGAAGVWWAINATTLLKAVAFVWLVHRGTWRTRTMPGPAQH